MVIEKEEVYGNNGDLRGKKREVYGITNKVCGNKMETCGIPGKVRGIAKGGNMVTELHLKNGN